MTDSTERPKVPWWQIVIMGRNPKVTFIRLLILAATVSIGFKLTVVPIRVTGISMSPTYKDGQRLFLNRASLWFRPISRSDIVGIRMAGKHVLLLKRVIALPGERFHIRNGTVYVDDTILDEPYVKERAPWNYPLNETEKIVGPNEYLVIGDNRGMAQDLHEWGLVDKERIVGRLGR